MADLNEFDVPERERKRKEQKDRAEWEKLGGAAWQKHQEELRRALYEQLEGERQQLEDMSLTQDDKADRSRPEED